MFEQNIYEFLKFKRELGDDKYYTIPEIKRALRILGTSERRLHDTCSKCLLLQRFGYLEAETLIEYHDVWMQNRTMRGFRFRISKGNDGVRFRKTMNLKI